MRLRVSAKHSVRKVTRFPEMFSCEWENRSVLTVSKRDVRITSHSHNLHENSHSDSHNSMEVILQKWRSSQNVFCDWRGLGMHARGLPARPRWKRSTGSFSGRCGPQQAICVVCDHTHCLPLAKTAFSHFITGVYLKIHSSGESANLKIEYSLKIRFCVLTKANFRI